MSAHLGIAEQQDLCEAAAGMGNTTSGRGGVRKDFLEKQASVLRDEQEEQARAKGTPT